MRKVMKSVGVGLALILGVVFITAIVLMLKTDARLNQVFMIQPTVPEIITNAENIEHGRYIYQTSCLGCHGKDAAGSSFFNDPVIGSIPAGNLTPGVGGIGLVYEDADYVRAIRHGVGMDGKPLMIMPSQAFWHFKEQDLADLIAYLKTMPAVDMEWENKQIKPIGRILVAVGGFGEVFSAESIDHNATLLTTPQQGISASYGEYLVNTRDCRACHGVDLAGAQSIEPGAPYSPGLDMNGALATWSAEDFIQTMRTGKTPLGRDLDAEFMPWKEIAGHTDEDLTAIFLYLQTLP